MFGLSGTHLYTHTGALITFSGDDLYLRPAYNTQLELKEKKSKNSQRKNVQNVHAAVFCPMNGKVNRA